MNLQTEIAMIDDYIDRIHANQKKMRDEDALRAVRTLSHLEAQKNELRTGERARPW